MGLIIDRAGGASGGWVWVFGHLQNSNLGNGSVGFMNSDGYSGGAAAVGASAAQRIPLPGVRLLKRIAFESLVGVVADTTYQAFVGGVAVPGAIILIPTGGTAGNVEFAGAGIALGTNPRVGVGFTLGVTEAVSRTYRLTLFGT